LIAFLKWFLANSFILTIKAGATVALIALSASGESQPYLIRI
jgi:hypothetical protein